VEVIVRENNVEHALRILKKKMQREGVYRIMKLKRAYEKPSVRKKREASESKRRQRKMMHRRVQYT
jgi:small subunit ribosomal protein S21